MADRKPRVQTRLEEGVYERLMAIGNILGMSTDTDILRFSITEFVKNNIDLMEKYGNMYKPVYLNRNEWYKVAEGKYGKWDRDDTGVIKITLFEVFSMNQVVVSETVLPLTFKEVVDKFNDADFDEKMNHQGIVTWADGETYNPEESEKEVLRVFGVGYGKEMLSRMNIDRHCIREIASEYEIDQLAWI